TGSPWSKKLTRYEFSTFTGGATPSNDSTLTTLAKQIATDWYLWQHGRLDQQTDVILNWKPEGLHDLEWRQDAMIRTRIQRMPFNPAEDLIPHPAGSDFSISDGSITCDNVTDIVLEPPLTLQCGSGTGTISINPTFCRGLI